MNRHLAHVSGGSKEIMNYSEKRMSNGRFVFVDNDIYDQIADLSCFENNRGYPTLRIFENDKWTVKSLARYVMGFPKGFDVDHVNGQKNDARRESLRTCTRKENLANKAARSDSKTGFKGVYYEHGLYHVRLTINGERHRYGSYATLENAVSVAEALLRDAYGEFARISKSPRFTGDKHSWKVTIYDSKDYHFESFDAFCNFVCPLPPISGVVLIGPVISESLPVAI